MEINEYVIKDKLQNTPEEIKATELRIYVLQEAINDLEYKLGLFTARVRQDIESELDESGKIKFSNEAKRETELKLRLSNMNEFSENKKALDKFKRDIADEQRIQRYQENCFRSIKYFILNKLASKEIQEFIK